MIIVCLLISILCVFVLILFLFSKQKEVTKLKLTNDKMKNEVNELFKVLPGDKVVFTQNLTYNKELSFTVNCESDVVLSSEKKVKIDVTSFNIVSGDEEVRKSLTLKDLKDFHKNNWINRRDIELILPSSIVREEKINRII